MSDPLLRITERLKDWAVSLALPFWADNARDAQGGFYEDLDLDAAPRTDIIRRVRVQARQVHVYALAHKLGWFDGQAIANETFDFMHRIGFAPDGQPGFVHLINSDYSVHDARRDLYDHAFYRLSCASLLALGEHQAAQNTDAAIQSIMDAHADPSGGWSETLQTDDGASSLPRRQNPHMHHFEAAMALYDATQNPAYLREAEAIFALFKQHFFDPDHRIIREFFTEDWAYWPGDKGRSVEPGHAAEWVWLLGLYEARTGHATADYAAALYDEICKTDGFLCDEADIDGTVRRPTQRLWVQTELAKAHLIQYARGDVPARDKAADILSAVETHYLQDRGTWIDQLDANGKAVSTTIPTSTFYHIIGMISEAERICNL